MASTLEVPVFTDTNLGTHIAIVAPLDITAGDFKRELERRHFSCFPKLGEIKVHGLMVKRRSCFYHLPESMPIKHAFQGLKGTWFLHIEARPLNGLDRPGLPKCVAAKVVNGYNVTNSLITSAEKDDMISNVIKALPEELPKTVPHPKKKKKKKKRVNNFLEYGNDGIENGCLSRNEETPGVNAKESLEEKEEQPKAKRDDNFSNIQADALPQFTVRTPPRTYPFLSPTDPRPGTSRNKHGRPEIGKRLVMASKNLRLSTNKQRSAASFCRRKNGKPLGPNAPSLAKYLVFEISDNED